MPGRRLVHGLAALVGKRSEVLVRTGNELCRL